jgi:hypothetical protein
MLNTTDTYISIIFWGSSQHAVSVLLEFMIPAYAGFKVKLELA